MKGYDHKKHSFPTKFGFSGSSGKVQNVRGYTRATPKPKLAAGGPALAAARLRMEGRRPPPRMVPITRQPMVDRPVPTPGLSPLIRARSRSVE